jgi:TPP-dependent pyruvate/acetoin dehydrogenase alpha subunit
MTRDWDEEVHGPAAPCSVPRFEPVPTSRDGSSTIWRRSGASRRPAVDGMDVLAVRDCVARAVAIAREIQRPALELVR